MAALRHGVHTVIIPADNRKDLEKIDQNVRRALNFISVSHVDQVLEAAMGLSVAQKIETKPAQEDVAMPVPVPEAEKKVGIRQ